MPDMADARTDPAEPPASRPPVPLAQATLAVAAGRPPRVPDGPLNAPITMASTFHAGGEVGYGRYGNETWTMFETAVGALEGGSALSFASGMAATAAVLDLVPPGGVVVAQSHAYLGTLALLRRHEETGRLTVRVTDLTDTAGAADAAVGADLVWVESPTNPLLHLVDIATVAGAARRAGALTVVDNTFATPVLQRPLETGADLVVHSATKFLSGHSDLILGVVVATDPDLVSRLHATRSVVGSVPSSFEAWLALRGLRTLHLRVLAAQANAQELAARLAEHDLVAMVHYPGWGATVSFEVRGDAAVATRVTESTRLWVHTTSLGGVESGLERRRRWAGESVDVPETLIRLAVGIEDIEDLWRDLAAALFSATMKRS